MSKRTAEMTEPERQYRNERDRMRYAANIEKNRARNRARYAADPEKHRAYAIARHTELNKTSAEYRDSNRERARAWATAHPEKLRERVRAWEEKNPEKRRALHVTTMNRRRARLQGGSSPGVTAKQWQAIVEYFGGRCAYCLRVRLRLERDHVIPFKRGGRDEPGNVVPACGRCNRSKNARILPLWYAGAVNGKRL